MDNNNLFVRNVTLALKRHFAVNRRLFVFGAAAVFVIYAVTGAAIGLFFKKVATPQDMTFIPMVEMSTWCSFVYFATGALLSVAASMAFQCCATRNRRISWLTLPVSKAQGLTAIVLLYLVAPLLLAVAATFAGELCRWAVNAKGYAFMFALSDTARVLIDQLDAPVGLIALEWLITLFCAQAVYFLGSVLFRRWSFIFTLGLSFVCMFVWWIACMAIVSSYQDRYVANCIAYGLVAIAAYVLAIWRYRRYMIFPL